MVANTNPAALTEYAPGATGNHAPFSTIATPGVITPAGIAFSDSGSLLVTGQGSGNVVTVSGGSSGSNAGPLTGLNRPTGVLVNEPLMLNDAPARFPQLAVGQRYSEHSYAVGGTPPYTWSIASGTLPAGLTLNPATGEISGTPTTPGTPTVVLRVTDSATPAASLTNTRTYTFPAVRPAVFVANGGNSFINAFPLSPLGNFSPLATFASGVGINAPAGLAFNSFGDLFVSNYGAGTITEYRGGRVANPVATDSGLTTPTGIAVGPNVAVSQQAANTLSEYSYDQVTGLLIFGVGHLGDISGSRTGLASPAGVVYTGGLWWVADEGSDSLTAYTPGVYGDVAPVKTISGPLTGLAHPNGIAVDGAGNLYVANQFGPSVTEYVAGASGNLAPFRTIAGTLTTLSGPSGLDLDASGNVWVANAFTSTVALFGPGASGNVAPVGSYGGALTQIKGPTAVAVTPPLAIITKRLPRAHRHHRYRAQLRAVEGTTPYRWTILRGHLPPGLHLSRSGLIQGRPRRAGRHRFTVLLRDSSHPRVRLTRRLVIVVRRH